jgi:hypothetical protein
MRPEAPYSRPSRPRLLLVASYDLTRASLGDHKHADAEITHSLAQAVAALDPSPTFIRRAAFPCAQVHP